MTIIESCLSWLQRQPIGMRYLMTHFAWRLCGWVFFILAVFSCLTPDPYQQIRGKVWIVYLCNVNCADPYLSSPCPTNYRRKVWCGFEPSLSSNQSPLSKKSSTALLYYYGDFCLGLSWSGIQVFPSGREAVIMAWLGMDWPRSENSNPKS